jgi:hypothetical protein
LPRAQRSIAAHGNRTGAITGISAAAGRCCGASVWTATRCCGPIVSFAAPAAEGDEADYPVRLKARVREIIFIFALLALFWKSDAAALSDMNDEHVNEMICICGAMDRCGAGHSFGPVAPEMKSLLEPPSLTQRQGRFCFCKRKTLTVLRCAARPGPSMPVQSAVSPPTSAGTVRDAAYGSVTARG